MFWGIGISLVINLALIQRKLSHDLKNNNSNIYKKYVYRKDIFGNDMPDIDFKSKEVLDNLNAESIVLLNTKNRFLKYVLFCFFLFAISGVLTVIKTW
jgi:hypothetical protein